MKIKTSISKVITSLLLLLFITNCNKKETPQPTNNPATNNPTVPVNPYTLPAVTFKSTVRGFVQDIDGKPIQNALVSTGTKTFTTDEDGMFELNNAPFTGDFCYLKAIKQGFFTASTTVHGQANSEYEINLIMVAQNNIHTFKATESKTISLPSGAKVEFPANAIKKLDGTPYTGQVNVAVDHINPDDPNFSLLIPGGDLRAYTAEGEDAQLYSYGMLNVELKDGAGNYLQLIDGKEATLSIPVPTNTEITPPATIPLWYFDENKGVWIEEGRATLQNSVYTGTVTHFTPYNVDTPFFDIARVKGKFVDCEGSPIKGFRPSIGQGNTYIDDDGNFERILIVEGITRKLKVYSIKQRKYFELNITIPPLIDNQVYDLGTIKLPCLTQVKAEILDCDNKPFKGSISMEIDGKTVREIITDGKLNLAFLDMGGQTMELTFKNGSIAEKVTKTITLPANGKKLDLGTITACPSTQTAVYFSFDYFDGTTTKTVTYENLETAVGWYKASEPYPLAISIKEFKNRNDSFSGREAYIKLKETKLGKHVKNNIVNPMSPEMWTYMYLPLEAGIKHQNFYLIFTEFNIQEYGKVGEKIVGTFSGDAVAMPGFGNSNVNITNGKFSVIRQADK